MAQNESINVTDEARLGVMESAMRTLIGVLSLINDTTKGRRCDVTVLVEEAQGVIYHALGADDEDAEAGRLIALGVLARTLNDIAWVEPNTSSRAVLRSPWTPDSEDAWAWICGQDRTLEFWCDLAGVTMDVVSTECAERMAGAPIGGLL